VGEGAVGEDAMTGRLKNQRGQWDVPDGAWGLLELVFPKPGMRPHNDTVRIDN
jgi:NADH dehydrogenase [ubiquinone] 1 alpha subcomplex assembly factor 3